MRIANERRRKTKPIKIALTGSTTSPVACCRLVYIVFILKDAMAHQVADLLFFWTDSVIEKIKVSSLYVSSLK